MKKAIAVLLSLILCLSFAACGDEGEVKTDSGKYIPGGTCFGMNVDEIKKARSEAKYGLMENPNVSKGYGHTVYSETEFGNEAKEYFGGNELSKSVMHTVNYHINDDGKLYSVDLYYIFTTERDLENALNTVVNHYTDLIGAEAEVTEQTHSIRGEWELDSAQIIVEAFFDDSLYVLDVWVTAPGNDRPERK